jgi:hypothetical protein
MPAVMPKMNAVKVIWTLLAMMLLAAAGRMISGMSM